MRAKSIPRPSCRWTLVATLDELDESNISRISLEGYQGGVGWFDDAYVRAYCGADAVATVGVEQEFTPEDADGDGYPSDID